MEAEADKLLETYIKSSTLENVNTQYEKIISKFDKSYRILIEQLHSEYSFLDNSELSLTLERFEIWKQSFIYNFF